jgi:hypothetical protein
MADELMLARRGAAARQGMRRSSTRSLYLSARGQQPQVRRRLARGPSQPPIPITLALRSLMATSATLTLPVRLLTAVFTWFCRVLS